MQTIKKIFLALIPIAAIGIYLKNSQKNISSDRKTFIIGTAAGYAPFVSINAQGEYEGFDIDVAKALAQDMNMNLEIKDLGSMSSLFIALDQGKIDAIIWGLSITQERLNKVAMIKYQGKETTSFPLIFWETIPNKATNIYELKNVTICSEIGSCQESVINGYDFITKLPVNNIDDALLNIQYKKADGAIVEPAIAQKFQKKFPQIKIIDLHLTPQDQIQGIGIAIKKDNIKLLNAIQNSIQNLENLQIISNLEQKWDITS